MSKDSLKASIHKYVDNSDEKILKVVHTILEQHARLQSEDALETISEDEIAELDKRWNLYKQGGMKVFTVNEVSEQVKKKLKTVKRR
ncbi:MAG: hypothetical protein IT236_17835 [Bacteroidia bacterium]|nr:hypothetical protein [Bacteroidia bacterium]